MIQTTHRFFGAFMAAATVTAALFWTMTALVRVGDNEIRPEPPIKVVLDVHVEPAEEPVETIRIRPVRQEVIEPEPLPPLTGGGEGANILHIKARGPAPSFTKKPGNLILGPPDGDAVPLVRVPPQYPPRAIARGLEGRVLVEFTISPIGTVEDPHIVAFEPTSAFNAAALEAIRQWRYEPKRVDGRAVAQPGIRIVIPFKKGDHRE